MEKWENEYTLHKKVSVWLWITDKADNDSYKITNFLWTQLWRDINFNSNLIAINSAEKIKKKNYIRDT